MGWQRRIIFLLLLAVVTILLSGCWDRRELDELSSVVAIAVDKYEPHDPKEDGNYLVTIQIPIPTKIAGGGEGEGGEGGAGSVQVMSSTGLSLQHALDNLQKRVNNQLFLGHTRVLLISEEVARDGVMDIIDFFRRNPHARRLMGVIITQNKAKDALKVLTSLEQVPAVYLISIMENGARQQMMPKITLGDFNIALSTPYLYPFTYYSSTGETDFSWKGLALFKEDKMVGNLSERESWLLMHLIKEGSGGNFILRFDEKGSPRQLIIKPGSVKTKLKTKVNRGQVTARYDVELEVDIRENNTGYKLGNQKQLAQLSYQIARILEEESNQLVSKLQREGIDALSLGAKIKAHHYEKWKKLNWKDAFPKANIDVHYDVIIRRTGLQTQF